MPEKAFDELEVVQDVEVDRLLLVSTSLWRWDPGQKARRRHKRLLNQLNGVGSNARSRVSRDSSDGQARHADIRAIANGATDIDVGTLIKGLDRYEPLRDGSPPAALRRRLDRFGHRVFLDAERFADVTGITPIGLPHHVVLEFRLQWHLRQVVCVVSVGMWSHLPWGDQRRTDSPGTAGVRLRPYWDAFQTIVPAAERLLAGHLPKVRPRVFGRRYEAPLFSFVVPRSLGADARDPRPDRSRLQADALASVLFDKGRSDDSVVTSSRLNGDLFVQRRFLPIDEERDQPQYVLFPCHAGASLQTDRALQTITALTDLEIAAAVELFELNTELDIWNNHLSVYDAALTRINRIWDGLATHLAVSHTFNLGRLHRAVGLIHQTLLQGFSDLAHASNLADEIRTKTEEASDDFTDRFDQALTEHHSADVPGLRAAFTMTGHFDRLRRRSQRVVEKARRVRSDAQAQVQAIADAFDERRVRETDALQKAGVLIAGLVAAFGWTALVNIDGGTGNPTDTWPIWMKVAPAVLVSVLVAAILLWRWRMSRLGSGRFRELYQWVRIYLKDSSTNTLNEFKRQLPTAEQRQELDKKLSRQFAVIWDMITRLQAKERSNRPKRDILALDSQFERDSMHLLLITERARALWEYGLPLLTCLYRQCSRLPGSFLYLHNLDSFDQDVNVVADEDLVLSLPALHAEEVRELDGWLRSQAPKSAREALKLLRRLELRPGMSRSETEAMLRRIGASPARHVSREQQEAGDDVLAA